MFYKCAQQLTTKMRNWLEHITNTQVGLLYDWKETGTKYREKGKWEAGRIIIHIHWMHPCSIHQINLKVKVSLFSSFIFLKFKCIPGTKEKSKIFIELWALFVMICACSVGTRLRWRDSASCLYPLRRKWWFLCFCFLLVCHCRWIAYMPVKFSLGAAVNKTLQMIAKSIDKILKKHYYQGNMLLIPYLAFGRTK